MFQQRKLTVLLSLFCLILLLTACGEKNVPASPTEEIKTSSINKEKTEKSVEKVEEEQIESDSKQQASTVTSQANQSENKEPAVKDSSDGSTNTNDSKVDSNQTSEVSKSSEATKPASTNTPPVTNSPPATSPSKPAATSPATGTETKTSPVQEQKPAASLTLSITGPKDRGTILPASKVTIQGDDTIFAVLLRIAKQKGIQLETRGSGATAYVEGIDNIYEFDYGMKSGWVFTHNGVSITKSIGTIKVKDGDRIECFYNE